MRRRLSYANVVSTLALFFALGGTVIAARHYLITSTRQIAPAVRQSLRGARGPAGPQGVTGHAGPVGPTGATGATAPAGPKGESALQPVPSGQSITGVWRFAHGGPGSPTTFSEVFQIQLPLRLPVALGDETKVNFAPDQSTHP